MSSRIIPGRSWTNKIRLPEDSTNLDVSTPVGAAAVGATVRILNSCRTIDDIGNVLAVAGSVTTTDADSKSAVVVGKKEYTVLVDATGKEQRTANPAMVSTMLDNGFKIDRIEEVDVTG